MHLLKAHPRRDTEVTTEEFLAWLKRDRCVICPACSQVSIRHTLPDCYLKVTYWCPSCENVWRARRSQNPPFKAFWYIPVLLYAKGRTKSINRTQDNVT